MRERNIKKDYLWNTIGTATYSLTSLLLSILVIRIIGKIDGGIFTFGFATFSQQILTIAAFGVKTIQIIDVNRKYTFSQYKIHRITTIVIAIIIGIFYLVFLYLNNTYNFLKSLIIFVLMFHGIIEGYFDVYEAEFQRQHLLYKAGFALFIRSIGWSVIFIIALYFTKNLLLSATIGMIVKYIFGYLYEIEKSKKLFIDEKNIQFDVIKTIKNITIEIFPIFTICFLDNLIYSFSKFAVDFYLGDIYTGFYNFLFLPANALYLLQYIISKPLLTPLSELYYSNKKEYAKRSYKVLLYSSIVAIVVFVVGMVFSKVYMNIVSLITNNMYVDLYGDSIRVLFFVLIGGMFYSFYVMLYYMLVIENKMKTMFFIYIILTILVLLSSTIFTKYFNMVGAAMSYALAMILIVLVHLILHLITLRRLKNE